MCPWTRRYWHLKTNWYERFETCCDSINSRKYCLTMKTSNNKLWLHQLALGLEIWKSSQMAPSILTTLIHPIAALITASATALMTSSMIGAMAALMTAVKKSCDDSFNDRHNDRTLNFTYRPKKQSLPCGGGALIGITRCSIRSGSLVSWQTRGSAALRHTPTCMCSIVHYYAPTRVRKYILWSCEVFTEYFSVERPCTEDQLISQ